MTPSTWLKVFITTDACKAAAANYHWIAAHSDPTFLPRLLNLDDRALLFEYVPGHHAQPQDLPALAVLLGRFHAALCATQLRDARMDQPFHAAGLTIPSFVDVRERRLLTRLRSAPLPDTWLTADLIRKWMHAAAGLPSSVYKDSNVRNFLIADTVIAVDFDVLTLAPFGYDLAKLVVSAVMTYGHISEDLVAGVLDLYNDAVNEVGVPGCPLEEFAVWAECHHVLTSPYLGSNGYQVPWSTARPGLLTP